MNPRRWLVYTCPSGTPMPVRIPAMEQYDEEASTVVPGVPFCMSHEAAEHLLGPAGTGRFSEVAGPDGSPLQADVSDADPTADRADHWHNVLDDDEAAIAPQDEEEVN